MSSPLHAVTPTHCFNSGGDISSVLQEIDDDLDSVLQQISGASNHSLNVDALERQLLSTKTRVLSLVQSPRSSATITELADFVVTGVPVPQGSMNAFVRNGRAIVTSANAKLKPWRAQVTEASRATGIFFPRESAICLHAEFFLPRPKSLLKRIVFHIRKPDLDKLVRAIGDGVTDSGLWVDDSQVVAIYATKHYVEPDAEPYAHISIHERACLGK